jgi:uncharacterized repeat protein (TIGR01451 family)
MIPTRAVIPARNSSAACIIAIVLSVVLPTPRIESLTPTAGKVASVAAARLTNAATVSGRGESNATNQPASATTTMVQAQVPDLIVAKTHTGRFFQGDGGVVYSITVSNVGGVPTTGTVTATDTLPADLTATAFSGTGWNCTLATLTCTRSDALAASASYPAITLTVDVAASAAASITNTATVSGGGEVNTANDTAIDPTTIVQVPMLTGLFPSHAAAGSGGFTLNVYGNNFASGAIVLWNFRARPTTFLNSQQLTAVINASDVASAGLAAVAVLNPSGGGTTTSFVVGGPNQGSLTAQTVNGAPGAPVAIPLVLTLNPGVTLNSLTFGVIVTPVGGAPALATALSFQAGPLLAPSIAPPLVSGTNSNLVAFFSPFTPSLSGTVTLGVVQALIPATATVGESYTVQVTTPDGAQGNIDVPLANGADATVSLVQGYLVGDAFPHTSDSVFGDGQLNTLELVEALRAVTGISPPVACSDRFDAMDAFPADTAIARGGDGILNTLDLITTLKRVVNLDTSRPVRAPRGVSCPSMAAENRRPPHPRPVEGTIEVQGNSIYVVAQADLNMTGLALALTLQEGQQGNFTRGDIPASIVDAGQPGRVVLAWLDGIKLAAGQRLLLGSVDSADRGRVLSVSANEADGREVRIVAEGVR